MPMRSMFKRLFSSEVEFQVLKSSSAVELHNYSGSTLSGYDTRTGIHGTPGGRHSRMRTSRTHQHLPRYHNQSVERSTIDTQVETDETDMMLTCQPSTSSHNEPISSNISVFLFNFVEKCLDEADESSENLDDIVRSLTERKSRSGFGNSTRSATIDSSQLPEWFPGFRDFDGPLFGSNDSLDQLLAMCNSYKSIKKIKDGILLKCVEKDALYPYLHFCIFNTIAAETPPDIVDNSSISLYQDLIAASKPFAKCLQTIGLFETISSMHRKLSSSAPESTKAPPECTDNMLPDNPYTGYICIAFKLLHTDSVSTEFEQSWLNWTGAKEIYRYCPGTWGLKKISFFKNHIHSQQKALAQQQQRSRHSSPSGSSRSQSPCNASLLMLNKMSKLSLKQQQKTFSGSSQFAYILLCEFDNIIHPLNITMACEIVERLKMRNTGHVGLYRVQWMYSNNNGSTNCDSRLLDSVNISADTNVAGDSSSKMNGYIPKQNTNAEGHDVNGTRKHTADICNGDIHLQNTSGIDSIPNQYNCGSPMVAHGENALRSHPMPTSHTLPSLAETIAEGTSKEHDATKGKLLLSRSETAHLPPPLVPVNAQNGPIPRMNIADFERI